MNELNFSITFPNWVWYPAAIYVVCLAISAVIHSVAAWGHTKVAVQRLKQEFKKEMGAR